MCHANTACVLGAEEFTGNGLCSWQQSIASSKLLASFSLMTRVVVVVVVTPISSS